MPFIKCILQAPRTMAAVASIPVREQGAHVG
jgi:hypothetical protein